jgi:branched-chain amino acid transport system ATP-binding protein
MSLLIKGLNVYYGDSQALWDVDMEIPASGLVSLVGANGAGKTTLMRAIVGLTPPRSGTVELDGVQILTLPPERRVQQGIALVPEGRRLFKGLSVQENLLLGAYARKDRSAIVSDLEKVVSYMPDLEPILNRLAGDLSGGQQQMCAVGRALMAKPRVLLVDEMSLGLAPVVVDRIADTLQRINRESGISILIVEQDVELSLSITETAYVLETGHVVASGASSELRQRDDIQAAYLGLH